MSMILWRMDKWNYKILFGEIQQGQLENAELIHDV